jgi:putative restriction endonuclease
VLCLCPNHHALFDLGAIAVDDGLAVVDLVGGRPIGPLRTHRDHRVDPAALAYHRSLFESD